MEIFQEVEKILSDFTSTPGLAQQADYLISTAQVEEKIYFINIVFECSEMTFFWPVIQHFSQKITWAWGYKLSPQGLRNILEKLNCLHKEFHSDPPWGYKPYPRERSKENGRGGCPFQLTKALSCFYYRCNLKKRRTRQRKSAQRKDLYFPAKEKEICFNLIL